MCDLFDIIFANFLPLFLATQILIPNLDFRIQSQAMKEKIMTREKNASSRYYERITA